MSSPERKTSLSPFRTAYAVGSAGWEAGAGELIRGLGRLGSAYRLGIVYVSLSYAEQLGDIEVLLRQATGVPHWVGAVGYGILGSGFEAFEEPAMAAMALPVAEESFRVFSGVREDTDAVIGAHADWLDGVAPPLILTHADPGNGLVPGLVGDLAAETEGDLLGGVACAAGPGSQLADGAVGGGLSGVMLAPDRIALQTGLTQGCRPIGPTRRVTRASESMVLELDGRPALQALEADLGSPLAAGRTREAGQIFAGLAAPGSETRDYAVRNLIAVDTERGAVSIGARVAAGDGLLFCRRDSASAVRDMRAMLDALTRRLGGRTARGAIYISCAARGPAQFRAPEREHHLIAEALGDVPLVGFFANGEISGDRLYSHTGVITVFM